MATDPFIMRSAPEGILVVTSGLTEAERTLVFDHMDALRAMPTKHILAPTRIIDQGEALELLYEGEFSPPIDVSVSELRDLAEALFIAHNRRLFHGTIGPKSAVRLDGRLVLAGFGWMPLLRTQPPPSGMFTAPEHLRGGASAKGDQFGFGYLAAELVPGLSGTAWHRTATDNDPAKRFDRMREAKADLTEIVAVPGGINLTPEGEGFEEELEPPDPDPVLTEPDPVLFQPDLLPPEPPPAKIVKVRTEVKPGEAGRIVGPKDVESGQTAIFNFVPNRGYRLDQWSIPGETGDRISLTASDSDLQVVAYAEPKTGLRTFSLLCLFIFLAWGLFASAPAIQKGANDVYKTVASRLGTPPRNSPPPPSGTTGTTAASGIGGTTGTNGITGGSLSGGAPDSGNGGRANPTIVRARVCVDSQSLARTDCPRQSNREFFAGDPPKTTCTMRHKPDEKTVQRRICPQSDFLATGRCPGAQMRTLFVEQVPGQYCPIHRKEPEPKEQKAVDICLESGAVASPDCIDTETRLYDRGRQPTRVCTLHTAIRVKVTLCRETGLKSMPGCPEGETTHVDPSEVPAPCSTEHVKPQSSEGELWTVCETTDLLPTDDCPAVHKRFPRGTQPKSKCTQHGGRSRSSNAATEEAEICKDSGLRANVNCPDIELRRFRKGRAPKSRCTTHEG